tara:strand:+ start:264 stop:467 length:204 start_codon:yes stop_codon:yes gene_type:complete
MAEQEKQHRVPTEPSDQDVEEADVKSVAVEQVDELKGQIDGLLDEIDEVLESNAEEFVKSYIQKGGE